MRETTVKRKETSRTAVAPRNRTQAESRAPGRGEFLPIRTPRAFEEIADQIRKQLSSRRLRPGDRLPSERALAEQFGVSRNTLREALRSLENAGLLRWQKGTSGGAFVRESTGDAVITGLRDMFHFGEIQHEDLTEARVWIEAIAVRTACERATAEDIEALQISIAAAERAIREKVSFTDQAPIHLEFHRVIARATKNPVMVIVMEALLDVMQHLVNAIGPVGVTRDPWLLASRRRFMRHFEARDSDAAVAEMTRHLELLNRYYRSLLKKKNRAETPTNQG